jgi:hypothetical protein
MKKSKIRKQWKAVLSALLSLAMVLSGTGLSVLADSVESKAATTQAESFTVSVPDWIAADEVTKTIDGNGTYKISFVAKESFKSYGTLLMETDLTYAKSGEIQMEALAVEVEDGARYIADAVSETTGSSWAFGDNSKVLEEKNRRLNIYNLYNKYVEADGYTEIEDTAVKAFGDTVPNYRKGDLVSIYFTVSGMTQDSGEEVTVGAARSDTREAVASSFNVSAYYLSASTESIGNGVESEKIKISANGVYSLTFTAPCYEKNISVLTLETDLGFYDGDTSIRSLAVAVAEDDGTLRGVYTTDSGDWTYKDSDEREEAIASTRRLNIKNVYNHPTGVDGYTVSDTSQMVNAFPSDTDVTIWKGDQVTVYFQVSDLITSNKDVTLDVPEAQEESREKQVSSFKANLVDNDGDAGSEYTISGNGIYCLEYTATVNKSDIRFLGVDTNLSFWGSGGIKMQALRVQVDKEGGIYSVSDDDWGFADAYDKEKALESTRRLNIRNIWNTYTKEDGYTREESTSTTTAKTVDGLNGKSIEVQKGDVVSVYVLVTGMDSYAENTIDSETIPTEAEPTRTIIPVTDSSEGGDDSSAGSLTGGTAAPAGSSTSVPTGDTTSSTDKPDANATGKPASNTTATPSQGDGSLTEETAKPSTKETMAPAGNNTSAPVGDTTSSPATSSTEAPEADTTSKPEGNITETPSADATQAPTGSTSATQAPSTTTGSAGNNDTQSTGSLEDTNSEATAYVVEGVDIAQSNTKKDGYLTVPQVQVTWDSNRSCDGYQIWKSEENGSFTKVDEIDDIDETEWFDTDVEKGCTYKYKVLGYKNDDSGSVVAATTGDVVSVTIRKTVNTPNFTAKRTGKNLKITFKKAEGTKCQIQVKYGSSGKWLSVNCKLKKKIVQKVSAKKLSIRIKTGEKVNGKMTYSKWSKTKTVK